MLPFVNATLTAITPVATSADYDVPAAAGMPRWSGEIGITVRERIVEVLTPGRVDEVKRTRLEIPYEPGRLVARGDTLTYTFEAAEQSRVVDDVSRAEKVGRVRVELQP